jgi:hypothetical protein
MQKYRDTVLDSAGNVVVGAVVTVALAGGGPATIYSDNGITVVASVLTANDGSFSFYAANGRYTITIVPPVATGLPTTIVTDILLEDPTQTPASAIVNTPAGNIVAVNVQAAINELDAEKALLAGSTSQPFSASTINGVPPNHVNDIINGRFQVAQAGTSFPAPANQVYDLDGWLSNYVSSAVFTVARVTGSSSEKLARQVTITTADTSIAASDYLYEQTRMEGFNSVKYVGNTFTIAARMKVPVAGIHCISLRNSGGDRSYVHEVNFPTANVFQDVSITVMGGLPTTGTWDYTNGVGLKIDFHHMVGSDYQTATTDAWVTGNYFSTANQVNDAATVGNVWAIEDVRIGLGTVAPINETSYEVEFARCQKYYPILLDFGDSEIAQFGSSTVAYVKLKTLVATRIPVAGIIYSALTDFTLYGISATSSFASIVFQASGIKTVGITITANASVGTVAADSGSFNANAGAGAKMFGTGCRL